MFEKFKPFVGRKTDANYFWPVTPSQVQEAEGRLGYSFPDELRAFYREIGAGFFERGANDTGRELYVVNRIVPPNEVADMVLDPLHAARPGEGFAPGAVPFFDLGERNYLILFPSASHPNRVFKCDGHTVVSDDLVEFFDKLFVSADFY